jgi:hypothetical protein
MTTAQAARWAVVPPTSRRRAKTSGSARDTAPSYPALATKAGGAAPFSPPPATTLAWYHGRRRERA